jgi:hypothetical protein
MASVPEIDLWPSLARPDGDWRKLNHMTDSDFSVAGLHYKHDNAVLFAKWAGHCHNSGLEYGIRLQREPENPHDPQAIAVIGFWNDGASYWEVPIGFVPKDYSHQAPADAPIAAELNHVFLEQKDDGSYDVDVRATILLPGKRSAYWNGRESPFR